MKLNYGKASVLVGLLLPMVALGDPAINTVNGYCHVGYDAFNQMNEIFFNPSEENGADIVVFNSQADGVCASEDVKVAPALLAAFFPPPGSYTLPYKIVLTGAKTGFLCRMKVDGGVTYYTNQWRSVVTVKTGSGGLVLDKKLVCRDGVARKRTTPAMDEVAATE